MADFSVGSAWVDLVPSAKGFSKQAKAALADVDLDKSVNLDADASKLEAAVKAAKAQLDSLNREKASPSIEFDAAVAEAKIAEVTAKLDELSQKESTPKVVTQTAEAERDLAALTRSLDEINARRATVNVDADITAAENAIRELEVKLDEVNQRRAQPQVSADTTQARQRLEELDSELQRVSTLRATPKVELQVAAAQQQALAIRAELDRLGALRPSVQVDADIASASAKLAVLNAELNRIDGRNVNVSADGSGLMTAAGYAGLLAGALGAVAAAAPAAIAALAGAAGAAGALGQGAGAAILGFSGISDAVKAVASDEKTAATSSAASSKTRSSGANQVASAQASLQQAQVQADRAAITGAQQVASAQQSLVQARTAQARTAVQGAQQIADAERSLAQAATAAARQRITSDQQVAAARQAVSQAIQTANQQVSSAEASLASAQRTRQYAQESLTRATEDATRANRDLQLSVADAGLAEQRAALSLAQARQRLAKNTSTDPLEMQDLQLSVQEASQNLKEVQVRYGDLRSEQSKWAQTGVQGSDQVVAATRSLQDAQRGVQDAQQGVTQAQVQGAQSVAAAQTSLAQTVQQAGWAQADAAAAVADAQTGVQRATVAAAQANEDAAQQVKAAQDGVAKAVQQAAWQQADASKGVADAQRALAQAYQSTGEAGASGGKQAAYALSKLSQAGRDFVNFLTGEWQPAWEGTSKAIADRMLPGIEAGMRSLLSLQPLFTAGLAESGGIIGDLAKRGGEMMASGPFRADFASIMSSNNRMLSGLGDAGLHVFGAMTDLWTVLGPIAEQFVRLADGAAQAFESWIIGERASGELQKYLQQAADTAMWLGGVLKDLVVDVWNLAQGFAPLGGALVEIIRYAANFIGDLASWNPILTSVVGGLTLAAVGASKLGTAMKGMAIAEGAGGLRGFASVMSTLFVPSNLAATSGMQKFGGAMESAAGKVGVGEKAAATFGGAMTKVGSALPVIGAGLIAAGIAYDTLTVSANDAADALLKGGAAAEQMHATMQKQTDFKNFLEPMLGGIADLIPSLQDATDEANKQYAAMTRLQQKQVDATKAQNDYDLAVRTFGTNSPQAVAAQHTLADATTGVKAAQDAARTATMNATQALQDQQDQILGSINSRLGLEQATRRVAQAQDAYKTAVQQSGANSGAAKDAEIELEQAQTAQAAAARKAATDELARKGVVDTSAGANLAYAQSIGQMVGATQGQLSPALTQMIQSLDWAGLSAAGAQVKINSAGQAVATFPNGKTVVLDANASPAIAQINATRDLVNSTKGTIGVDADTGPGVAKVGGFKLQTDATTGVVTIAGNITPADQARLGIQAKTDGTTGTMWINGNPVPCDGKLNGMRVKTDGTTGTMTIDGNPRPATDQAAHARDVIDGTHGQVQIGANYDQARKDTGGFWGWIKNLFTSGPMPIAAGGGLIGGFGFAHGGLVGGLARGGLLRGPGTGTSDSILGLSAGGTPTARVSNGEYVVNAKTVKTLGVGTMNRINAMATGGLVGLAAGGQAQPQTSATPLAAPAGAAPAAPAAGAVPIPAGDPAAASAAAAATDALSASMAGAVGQAAVLGPALATLATTQAGVLAPATALVTAGQQALVNTGILPLVGTMVSALFPTLGLYQQQVGVAAPLANTALQTAQLGTQLSTDATALNTELNSAAMNTAVTGMSLTGQVQHGALQGAQLLTQLSTNATALNTAINSGSMVASTTGMSLASQNQLLMLRYGHDLTNGSTNALAINNANQNNAMISSTGFMSGQNQMHLANLRGGQAVTSGATAAFADGFRAQMGRTVPDSADPIRWVINFPIRSITDAWNNLDGQFALGKHVNPYIPGFASGGEITGPGSGKSDSIMARVSDGEFIVRESVASRVPHFLNALNGGQAEAIRAAGGQHAKMPGFAEGGVIHAQQVAASMNGKPYIWGGASPAGADCSGMAAIVTNALRGESNPFHRIGTAASNPWPGFVRGLSSAWSVGWNSGHMAGTLGGVNVESAATPIRYPGGHGADSGQFTGTASLPQVGGVFASGGNGGGGGFDPTPMVDAAFAKTYQQIGDVPRFFGPSAQVGRDQGVAKTGADMVKAKAMSQLQTMFAGSGLFGPVGAGAPFIVKQISDAARILGKGVDGATIGVATGLVESNLTNLPGGDRDSVGVFQQRPSQGWGSIAECMNVLHAAGEFFKRFPGNWHSMPPGDVAQSVQRSAFPGKYATRMGQARGLVAQFGGAFDNGGLLGPGATLAYNNTGTPERVLDNVETRNYDTLTRLMRGGSGVQFNGSTSSTSSGVTQVNHFNQPMDERAYSAATLRRLDFQQRLGT